MDCQLQFAASLPRHVVVVPDMGSPLLKTTSLKRAVQAYDPQPSSSPSLDPVLKCVRRTSTPDEMQLLDSCPSLANMSEFTWTPPSTPTDCGSDDTMQHLVFGSDSPSAASAAEQCCWQSTISDAGDGFDADQEPIRALLQLVREHKQQLVFNGAQPAVLEHLMDSVLSDTDTALTIALSAMDLATAMCAHGSPEAADKALGFAEQALQLTVQKVAKAQLLVQEQEEQQCAAFAVQGVQPCMAFPAAALEHSVASVCAGLADSDDRVSCADSPCPKALKAHPQGCRPHT